MFLSTLFLLLFFLKKRLSGHASAANGFLQGAICLDTLSTGWSPVNTIKTALLSLRLLLICPNPSDPQDAQVAKQMNEEPEYFKVVAHDWAVRYANAPRTMPPPSEYKVGSKTAKAEDDPAQ